MQRNVLNNLSYFLNEFEKFYQYKRNTNGRLKLTTKGLIKRNNLTGHYLLDSFLKFKNCLEVNLDDEDSFLNFFDLTICDFKNYFIDTYGNSRFFENMVENINKDIYFMIDNSRSCVGAEIISAITEENAWYGPFSLLFYFHENILNLYRSFNKVYLYEGNDKSGKTTAIGKSIKEDTPLGFNSKSFDFFSVSYDKDISYLLKKFESGNNQILNVSNIVNKSIINYNESLGDNISLYQDRSIFSTILYNFHDYIKCFFDKLSSSPAILKALSKGPSATGNDKIKFDYVNSLLVFLLNEKTMFDLSRYAFFANYYISTFNSDLYSCSMYSYSLALSDKKVNFIKVDYNRDSKMDDFLKLLKSTFFVTGSFLNFDIVYDFIKDFNFNGAIDRLLNLFVFGNEGLSAAAAKINLESIFNKVYLGPNSSAELTSDHNDVVKEVYKELSDLVIFMQDKLADCINNLTRIIYSYEKECSEFLLVRNFKYNINVVNFINFENRICHLGYGICNGLVDFNRKSINDILKYSAKNLIKYSYSDYKKDFVEADFDPFIINMSKFLFLNTFIEDFDNYERKDNPILLSFYLWYIMELLYTYFSFYMLDSYFKNSFFNNFSRFYLSIRSSDFCNVVKYDSRIFKHLPDYSIGFSKSCVEEEGDDSVDCDCPSKCEVCSCKGESIEEDDYSETIKVVPSEERCDCDMDNLDCGGC